MGRPRALTGGEREAFSNLCPVRSMASEVGVGTEGVLAMRSEDLPEQDELTQKDSGLSDLKEREEEEEVEWTYPEGGLRAWLVVLVSDSSFDISETRRAAATR